MSQITGYQGIFSPDQSTSIANGQTKSAAIPTGGKTLCGIILPAAFTGVALTFEASSAVDGTFVPVKKADGSSLSYTVAQGTFVAIDPKDFYGIAFLKLVSGSAEGGARTVLCALKGI